MAITINSSISVNARLGSFMFHLSFLREGGSLPFGQNEVSLLTSANTRFRRNGELW
jgi:hypothetical protein